MFRKNSQARETRRNKQRGHEHGIAHTCIPAYDGGAVGRGNQEWLLFCNLFLWPSILHLFLILHFCFPKASNGGNYCWNSPLKNDENKINFPEIYDRHHPLPLHCTSHAKSIEFRDRFQSRPLHFHMWPYRWFCLLLSFILFVSHIICL